MGYYSLSLHIASSPKVVEDRIPALLDDCIIIRTTKLSHSAGPGVSVLSFSWMWVSGFSHVVILDALWSIVVVPTYEHPRAYYFG